jgi:hypothetical protein
LSDTDEAALLLKRSPGGIDGMTAETRVRVDEIQDEQLQRAEDLLKGLLLYDQLTAAPKPEKLAAK